MFQVHSLICVYNKPNSQFETEDVQIQGELSSLFQLKSHKKKLDKKYYTDPKPDERGELKLWQVWL